MLLTSWPAVCKECEFLEFCDQIQSTMHQRFTQMHSTMSIGSSHMYMISAGPKWDFLPHPNTTHPHTIKPLQTTKRTKLGLLSLPSMWFLTKSWHTPYSTGKRWNDENDETSAMKPCSDKNNKATNPWEGILSYKIFYQILNSWNVTLLTFHFSGTAQHNSVSNSIPILWNRTKSPKKIH